MKLARPLRSIATFCLFIASLTSAPILAQAEDAQPAPPATPATPQGPTAPPATPATQPATTAPPATAAPQAAPAPTPAAAPPKSKRQRAPLTASKSIRINYSAASLNVDPNHIDTASLIMREGATGHVVQVHLVETDVNSGVFSGLYSINWKEVEKLQVEFYVPEQKMLESNEGMKKVADFIAHDQLKRHPFVLRRTPRGAQTIELFDNREQAEMALTNFRAQLQVQGLQNQKFPSDQAVDTAALAEKQKLANIADDAETKRAAMEAEESKRLAEMMAAQAKQNEAEQAERKKQAEDISAQAMTQYQAGKFPTAKADFEKAIELDPENHSYYYQYGVTLYKLDQFDKSLIYLNLAEGPQVNTTERNFFMALDYFRLKGYEKAAERFDQVIKSGEPEMTSAATFYMGVIKFEEKKWEPAKTNFQMVLDTTKDPQLDKRSEEYIEQILRNQRFDLERSRKWQISATVGEQYDSNVNLNSNSSLSQGAVTNVDGLRSMFIGSGRYRPIYEENHEFAAQLDVLTMYTTDTGIKYNQTLRNADPIVITASAPWTYKGLLLNRGYKLDLTPGAESINMSVEDNTQKEIIYSFFFNVSNLLVVNESLYSNFNLEFRHDQNQLASESGANDSTGYKVRFVQSNLHFITSDKTKIITSEGDLTLNTDNGANESYNRIDLAVGYLQPVGWSTTGTAKLGFYYVNYPTEVNNRTDDSYTLTLGASKKLSDIYSTGLVGTYNINQSNEDTYTYNKFTVLLTFSALYAF